MSMTERETIVKYQGRIQTLFRRAGATAEMVIQATNPYILGFQVRGVGYVVVPIYIKHPRNEWPTLASFRDYYERSWIAIHDLVKAKIAAISAFQRTWDEEFQVQSTNPSHVGGNALLAQRKD